MECFGIYSSFIETNRKERLDTIKKNKALDKRHRKLEALLLANPKEVSRLSDLIILEQQVCDAQFFSVKAITWIRS